MDAPSRATQTASLLSAFSDRLEESVGTMMFCIESNVDLSDGSLNRHAAHREPHQDIPPQLAASVSR